MPDEVVRKVNLNTSPFSKSKVDILIPFHGQQDKVLRLIKSILKQVRSNPYQITLIDDASPEKEPEDKQSNWATLAEVVKDYDKNRPSGTRPILQLLRNKEQLGFGGSLLHGYQKTDNPWVLFMHSDCLVEDNHFMIEMGRSLLRLKEQNVRMVSARTSRIAHGPASLVGERGTFSKDIILQDEDYLPLFCTMAHRELFHHIGGFVRSYPYTGYEDIELAHRLRHFKFKQAVCGRAWINHEGSGTMKNIYKANPKIMEVTDQNRDLCIADMRQFS